MLIHKNVEVSKAGMFSIQMDTPQDFTSKDQCAVVLQFVTDVVQDRLIAVTDCDFFFHFSCDKKTGGHFLRLIL